MRYAILNYLQNRLWVRQLAVHFVINAAINFFVAAFITYVLGIGHGFLENLVFSFCIGILIWFFLDVGRLILWSTKKPPLIPFFLLCLVAIPSGRVLGELIAVNVLGMRDKHLPSIFQENPLRFVAVTVLISITIIWFFWNRGTVAYLRAEAETEKARAAAIEKQALQAQLQLLQAQIEPHMLFNTLANVQGLIAIDPGRAQQMLDQLILYLRATLCSSRAEKTTLAHEFALMQAYLELMSVRMGARLSYALTLPESLRELSVPPMLLQPLIENAIKHGLEPNVSGGSITVVARETAGRLTLSVTDTGLGLTAAPSRPEQSGVGLENVRERLQALHREQATLTLSANTPNGAIAELSLPLTS